MNHYETVKIVIEFIIKNKLYKLSLAELAKKLKMSENRLRKIFAQWAGITPKQFTHYLGVEYAKELLALKNTTLATTHLTRFSGGGRLYDLFVDIEAITPGEYQNSGQGLTIDYFSFTTRFGQCVVGATERGLCNILFCDSTTEGLADLRSRWPCAKLICRHNRWHTSIRQYFNGLQPRTKIKLHLRGTNFQIKVWEALLSIPDGHITTYGHIAAKIGNPRQGQAVGRAVGANPIGYIIPCHRVLKSTGQISGYHWGISRKRVMLAYEAVQNNKNF